MEIVIGLSVLTGIHIMEDGPSQALTMPHLASGQVTPSTNTASVFEMPFIIRQSPFTGRPDEASTLKLRLPDVGEDIMYALWVMS